MSSVRIRKQVYELTVEDLDQSPVWEFALDEEDVEGQDEATVRPYESSGTLDPSEGMFVVRCRLTLADGTEFTGYLTPPLQGDSSLGTLQPAVVGPMGQVSFWYGMMAPEPAHIEQSYARLGKSSPSQVFPLRFNAQVPMVGGPVAGEIPGFLVLEDFSSMRTRVLV